MDLWAFRINWANKAAKPEISSSSQKVNLEIKTQNTKREGDAAETSGVQTLWIQPQKHPAAVTMIDMHIAALRTLRRRLD